MENTILIVIIVLAVSLWQYLIPWPIRVWLSKMQAKKECKNAIDTLKRLIKEHEEKEKDNKLTTSKEKKDLINGYRDFIEEIEETKNNAYKLLLAYEDNSKQLVKVINYWYRYAQLANSYASDWSYAGYIDPDYENIIDSRNEMEFYKKIFIDRLENVEIDNVINKVRR